VAEVVGEIVAEGTAKRSVREIKLDILALALQDLETSVGGLKLSG